MSEQVPSKELMPHWSCKTHGAFDARVAVGCPECVRQLREDVRRWENAHKILLAEVDRLKKYIARTAVTGGRAAPEPAAVVEEGCGHCQGTGRIGTPGSSCPFCSGEGVRRRDAGATQPPGDGRG